MQTMQQRFESAVEAQMRDLEDLTPVVSRDFNNTGFIYGMEGFTTWIAIKFNFQTTACDVKVDGSNFEPQEWSGVQFDSPLFPVMMDKIAECVALASKYSESYAQRVDARRAEMRREIQEIHGNKLVTPCGVAWEFSFDHHVGTFSWSHENEAGWTTVYATPWYEGMDGIPVQVEIDGVTPDDGFSHLEFPDVRDAEASATLYVDVMAQVLDDHNLP